MSTQVATAGVRVMAGDVVLDRRHGVLIGEAMGALAKMFSANGGRLSGPIVQDLAAVVALLNSGPCSVIPCHQVTGVGGYGPGADDAPASPPSDASVLTVVEVASRLRVSPRTVWRRIGTGQLAAVGDGGCTRVRVTDLDDYVGHLPARGGT